MSYYGWTEDYVRKGMTGARGWVWYNYALENEANIWGQKLDRTTPGYVAQERERILCQRMQVKSA